MIRLVVVGKIKENYWDAAIKEYSKRLKPYSKLEIIEVADSACPPSASEAQKDQVKMQEGMKILDKISSDDFVIALDLKGKNYSSEEISEKMQEVFTYKTDKITFLIGGSLGYSNEVLERANLRWQLSNCTFPHQIVRVLLLEQIYRAYKIMKNENYHK